MLHKIRLSAGSALFALVTLLFLDFTGTLHQWFGWLAKIQLLPAILAVNLAALVCLAGLTLLFGRVYCSVICPLGVLQDAISGLAGKFKKNRFRYAPAKTWLRYAMLGVFIAAGLLGVHSAVALLEPYSAYGRIAANLLAPCYQWGNNLLAALAARADSYAFYSVTVWLPGLTVLVVAALTLGLIVTLAWRGGRTYCNTLCPAGTALGLLSRFALFRPVFDPTRCKKCGRCERNCKASCIDASNFTIDHSRCVSCFTCLTHCRFGALRYAPVSISARQGTRRAAADEKNGATGRVSRRGFLSLVGLLALTPSARAQQPRGDGGLADIQDKKAPARKTPITPPGAGGARNLGQRCTACQLCVSVCPTHVLRPSARLATLMQPEVTYEQGYCRPECTKCSQVCPTGAIRAITPAGKSAIAIGQAVWLQDNCIVHRDGVQCDSCVINCPTGAITLVAVNPDDKKSLKTPLLDGALCIGCGACENLCPARPFSAIYVEGNVVHHSV
ncbi:MAG: 4Fe-4S binding protein [Verrucomicrobiales bacterium]|jgi:ferredoxin|nr:4Fe-4S binding protein [Verrucomicrobiales bacterium]